MWATYSETHFLICNTTEQRHGIAEETATFLCTQLRSLQILSEKGHFYATGNELIFYLCVIVYLSVIINASNDECE
jgi:hypothetical protein